MVKRTQSQSIPPTMPPQQAIPLLQRQVERLEEVIALRYDDPRVDAWESTTTNILNAAYGQPNGDMHNNTRDFAYARGNVSLHVNMSEGEVQAEHIGKQQKRRQLLLAYLEQLQDLAPPVAGMALAGYRLHPQIESVAGQLLQDGHFKQAALEAYICVIESVKQASGLADDGDRLMNRAFGCENQVPIIKFNSLQTAAEVDEQRGIMYLFKGIVGLRNSKAHSNTLFNDPFRANEYLALSSLLLRLLQIGIRTP